MSTARAPVSAPNRALSEGEATTSDAVSRGPHEWACRRQGVPCATTQGIVRLQAVTARCSHDLLGHDQIAGREVGRQPAGEAEGENGRGVEALQEILGRGLCRRPAHAAHGEKDVGAAYRASKEPRCAAVQALPAPQAEKPTDLLGEGGDNRKGRGRLPEDLHR